MILIKRTLFFLVTGCTCVVLFSSCNNPTTPTSTSAFWQTISQLPPISTGVNSYIPAGAAASMAVSDQGDIFTGTSNGCVYCSTNAGGNWIATILSPDNSGNSGVTAMAVTANGVAFAGIASTSQLYGGVFASSNNGATWYQTSFGTYSVYAIVIDDVHGYIYAGTGYESGIFRSSDYGVSWTSMDNGLTDPGAVHPNIWSMTIDTYGNVYAGTASGEVFVSSDYGATWLRTSLAATSGITAMTIGNDQYAYAGTEGDSIYVSSDRGATWILASAGIGAVGTSGELWNLVTGLHGGIFMGILSGGAYVTTDHGNSWSNISSGINDGIGAMAASPSGYILAGGVGSYIYSSVQTQ